MIHSHNCNSMRILCVNSHVVSCLQKWLMPETEQVYNNGYSEYLGLERLCYEDRLRDLGLYSLKKRKLEGDFLNVCQHLKGGCQEDGARLCPVLPSNGKEAMGRD